MRLALAVFVAATLMVSTARAAMVEVEWTGEVDFNLSRTGEFFFGQGSGSPARALMTLDSNTFTNSGTYPTRGYAIQSFSLEVGSVSTGLQNPFPAGQTPFFVLRDNDPAVDGFFLSTNVDVPVDPPLAPAGRFGQYQLHALVTYGGTTLSSLDILGAVGTYDYTGLTVFGFNIVDGGNDVVGLIFTQLTIREAPVPVEATTWGRVKTLFRASDR